VIVHPDASPPYDYTPPPREPISRPREWALNLHVEGAAIGHGAGNAGMGGAGLGLRYKPNRHFGIETDLDLVGGTDYQNDARTETAFTINGLIFLNPRSRAQVYLLAGFGWSGAHVSCNSSDCNGPIDRHYTYFGGQMGGGLELRLTRALALNADVRGFIRTRIDDRSQSEPEFTDQYGRSSNTSGGALFTGGMSIYF
jgi:opacity protein-like surface antigen